MKVRHYSNSFTNKNKHWQMTQDFGDTNTDTSMYRPDISTVRAFAGNPHGSNMTGLYDFKDGKDTGDRIMMYLRDKSLDVTEIDRIGEVLRNKVDAGKLADLKAAEKEALGLDGKKLLDWVKKYIETNPVSVAAASPAPPTVN